jgi:hypothetical protein
LCATFLKCRSPYIGIDNLINVIDNSDIMGLLNRTRTYLVGHMQYFEGRSWREEITPKLTELGIVVFDPYKKPFIDDVVEDELARKHLGEWMANGEYDRVAERMKRVRNFDLRICDLSDFIIAHIIPGVASWGAAEELVTSCRAKKPVFISVEGGKKAAPLWVMGMFPHKYIYDNLDDVMAMLKKIDAEEKVIDSDRWKLLKQEYR